MKTIHVLILHAAIFVGLVPSITLAQSASATITGTVQDQTGASVTTATVVAVQVETGVSRQTVSSGGDYTISNLPIGSYRVTVSAPGFKTSVIPDAQLQVNQTAQLNFTLQLGAVSEQVSVTTANPMLSTESASVGTVIENRSIESLALNGRQFWQLVALVPGASYTPGGQGTRTGGGSIRSSAVNVQINGTGFIYNGWLLDGVDITEYEQGGTNVQPNVDALDEFKVESANMPAEYGHTPNVVSATMKSGTNSFHGTLFEFIRNDAVDARNFFATSRNALKRNQFGATFGGPIKRNKVFFFGDIERSTQRQEIVFNNTLPTDLMRAGNFTGQRAITDPSTGRAFTNNLVPANRISPQANYFLRYLPTQAQGRFNAPQSLDIYKGDIKVDVALTDSDRLMSRYSAQDNLEGDPNQFPSLGIQDLHSRGQNLVLTETHIFNPHWLNELRLGYYRDYFLFGAVLPGTNFLQQAGITGFEQTQLSPSFPLITMSGYASFNGSGSNNLPKANRIRTWQYNDSVTYASGKHDMKFGAQLYHQTHGFFNGQSQEGVFNFTTNYTGNSFGDYLLGLPNSVFRAYPLVLYGNYTDQWAGFWQDTFKATSTLTLTFGLRWAYNPFFNGINGQTSAIDYPTGKVIVPTRNGAVLNPIAQPEMPLLIPLFADRTLGTDQLGLPDSIRRTGSGQWLPRFGFAWRPGGSDRFVVRGAYGIFDVYLDSNLTLQWAKVPPFEITQTINNTTPTPGFNWANPFLGQPLVSANTTRQICPGTGVAYATCVAPNVYSAPGSLKQTYMQQYNFTVQTQLAKDMSVEVAYVGNNTSHAQLISVPDNMPSPGAGVIQSRRPYPQWGQFFLGLTSGRASYNALQTKFEKRFAHGYQMLASYTWSKCLDLGSNQNSPTTYASLFANHSVCDYDLPHNLTISSLYQLPFGRNRQFLSNSNRFLDSVLGGWEIAGILTDRSGLPFTPTISGDQANTGVSGQRPMRTGNGTLSDPTPSLWFDPNAFSVPARYTYGNSGRNILRADGLIQLDVTLKKNFAFAERRFVEFRAEAFNIANHATFAAPNATIGSTSAGLVTTTLNSGRILQGALKFVF